MDYMNGIAKKTGLLSIQTMPGKNVEENIERAFALLDEALASYRKTDLVVMPECYGFFPDLADKEKIGEYSREIEGALCERAMLFSTYIVGGTVVNSDEEGKLHNTALVIDRSGFPVGKYDKIHLFDVLDGSGENKESAIVEPGKEKFIFDTDFGRVGIAVCYDMRFPEMIREYAEEGVTILAVPAAFFMPRYDHYLQLLRTAALTNGMYVVSANLFGNDERGHNFCGRSAIFDPWGIKIAGCQDAESYCQAYVDAFYAEEVRKKLGIL